MTQNNPASAEETDRPRKSLPTRIVPIVVVIVLVAAAFAVISRPAPGRRTATDTSVQIFIGQGEAKGTSAYPVVLQEGGDPAHEADHVIEPLKGVDGVASATFDWSSGLVLEVAFDPDVISAQEIADLMAQSGYLAAPSGQ